jgi:hypothetical protein
MKTELSLPTLFCPRVPVLLGPVPAIALLPAAMAVMSLVTVPTVTVL